MDLVQGGRIDSGNGIGIGSISDSHFCILKLL